MQGSIHHEQRRITPTDNMPTLLRAGEENVRRRASQAVHAPYLLNGGSGNPKELAAHSKQNDLFGALRTRSYRSGKPHQRTPTSVARQMPITCFSSTAQISSMASTWFTAPV